MDKNFVQLNKEDPFEDTNFNYRVGQHGRLLKPDSQEIKLKKKTTPKMALLGQLEDRSLVKDEKNEKSFTSFSNINFQSSVIKSVFEKKKKNKLKESQEEIEKKQIDPKSQEISKKIKETSSPDNKLLWQKVESLENKLVDLVKYSYKSDEQKKQGDELISVEDFWQKYANQKSKRQFNKSENKKNSSHKNISNEDKEIERKKKKLSKIYRVFKKFNKSKEELANESKPSMYPLIEKLPWGKEVDFQKVVAPILAIIFISGTSFFISQQFFHLAPKNFASELIRPTQTLSFQGRVTDTTRTPIIAAKQMRFEFFDADGGTTPPPSGGNKLWDSNFCSVTPDRDGVFNVKFGAGEGLGADNENCGGTLDDVFDKFGTIYLQITIEGEVLFPRQLIKSVPYALNSDTLRGFPPSLSATANTIPVLNDEGNMVLNTDSSSIINEGGNIILESLAETGNIHLLPGGSGSVLVDSSMTVNQDLQVDGSTTTTGDSSVTGNLDVDGTTNLQGDTTMQGNLQVDGNIDTDSNLTVDGTSTLTGEVTTGTDVGVGGDLDVAGNTNMQGNLDVTGTTNLKDDVTLDKTLTLKSQLPASVGVCEVITAGKMYFSSDTNSYFYCNGAVWIEITSGAPSLYVLLAGRNDGQTIIGSSNGVGGLVLKGSSDDTGTISLNPDGGLVSIGASTQIAQDLSVGGNTDMTGNLQVDGDASFGSNVNIDGTLTSTGAISTTDTFNFTPLSNLAYLNLLNDSALRIQTGPDDDPANLNPVLSLLNNGNLGLGVTNPTEKLEIDYGHLRFNYVNNPLAGVSLAENVGSAVSKISAPSAPQTQVLARSGNLEEGTYQYAVSYVTSDGMETSLSPVANASTTTNNTVVLLDNIATSPHQAVTKRKIYRTIVDGAEFKYLTTLDDNSTQEFIDDIKDENLGGVASNVNETGTYYYYVTFVTANGETGVSPVATITLSNPQSQVDLSGIPVSADDRVTGRKIYRSLSNFDKFYLLTTIADNTTTTFTDTVSDTTLVGVTDLMPKTNSTAGSIFGEDNLTLQIGDDGTLVTQADLIAQKRVEVSHSDNQGLKLPISYGVPQAKTGQQIGDIVYDTIGRNLYIYDGSGFNLTTGGSASFGSANNNNCAGNVCHITLTPEYSGATFYADGTDNQGSYTTSYEVIENSGNYYFFNYYKFTSFQNSLQDYDLVVNVKMPSDFQQFSDTGLTVDYLTSTNNLSDVGLDVTIYKETIDPSSLSVAIPNNVTSNVWGSAKIGNSPIEFSKSQLASLNFKAGNTMMIVLKTKSRNSSEVKVGEINLFYQNGGEDNFITMQDFTMADCASHPTPAGTDYTLVGSLSDSRDGKIYEIRKFADGKCWMVSNLMYGGTGTDNCSGRSSFSGNGSSTPTNRFGTGTYGDCRDPRVGGSAPCTAGSTECGYYYNWQAAMQDANAYYNNDHQPTEPTQGICPDGWHVPSKQEFVDLDIATGGSGANRTDSTNQFWRQSYPFKGLYSGYCNSYGSLYGQGSYGAWWGSSQYSSTYAYLLFLSSSGVNPQANSDKYYGFGVRCVKN